MTIVRLAIGFGGVAANVGARRALGSEDVSLGALALILIAEPTTNVYPRRSAIRFAVPLEVVETLIGARGAGVRIVDLDAL